jgi:hypothetical protein
MFFMIPRGGTTRWNVWVSFHGSIAILVTYGAIVDVMALLPNAEGATKL